MKTAAIKRNWALEVTSVETGRRLHVSSGMTKRELTKAIRAAMGGDLPYHEFPWETVVKIGLAEALGVMDFRGEP